MNRYKLVWERAEKTYPRPQRVRHVVHREYAGFRERVLRQDYDFVGSIVDSLYHGDVYILHDAFDPAFLKATIDKAIEWGKQRPSEFHKMLEGCPDFHRIIDLETGKNYSFNVCKHSYYFYPWNDDPLELFFTINKRWRVMKILMGLDEKAYETNTPKDGVVDRIQIAQYPSKIGYLEPHSDPYLHQRLFFSGYMTERGKDYEGGGFYCVGSQDKVVDVEGGIKTGDVGIGYATIYHGVSPCNRDKPTDWDSREGRWFLSMYSNASDEVENRHTGHPVKLNLEGVTP